MTRGTAETGPTRPQFRCRVCKEFVRGTESGHCSRCGLAAPTVPVLFDHSERTGRSQVVVALLLAVLLVLIWDLTRN